MKRIDRIAVIGAGSWGSALSDLIARKNIRVMLYVRRKELLTEIRETHMNSIYLKNIKLSNDIMFTNDVGEALDFADIIIFSIPVKFLRQSIIKLKNYIKKNHIIISVSKGMENGTYLTPLGIIKDVLGMVDRNMAVLSGPNFAMEVAKQLPSATVLASRSPKLARYLALLLYSNYFRIYISNDPIGVEIGGALKNIIAIASGISDGLHYGDNAKASLITRGLFEIYKLGNIFKAKKTTFMGLAGIGDLVLTCTGNLSRNRNVGIKIAKGERLDDILNSTKAIPEGVNTVESVYNLSKDLSIKMPITEEVFKIIYQNKDPYESLDEIMKRPIKQEFYY